MNPKQAEKIRAAECKRIEGVIEKLRQRDDGLSFEAASIMEKYLDVQFRQSPLRVELVKDKEHDYVDLHAQMRVSLLQVRQSIMAEDAWLAAWARLKEKIMASGLWQGGEPP